MHTAKSKRFQTLIGACITSAFAAMVLYSGCDDNSVTSSKRDQIYHVLLIATVYGT